MSKKRKTRKQKETALGRKINKPDQVEVGHPVYSVVAFSDRHEIKKVEKTQKREVGENIAYLKKDIYKIVTASGIIVAANILLFTLLSTGTLRLNFLGY